MRVFVAVAQHGSFSLAADFLGVGVSAASMQIRALEEYLGRPLFRRSGRGIALSEFGRQLLPRLQQALYDIESAVDDVRLERHADRLGVSMLASFLHAWLLPRLETLRARHPGLELHVHTSSVPVDFVHSTCHAAIRYSDKPSPGLTCLKLMEDWLLPVCTPAIRRRHGLVRGAGDLQRHELIHSTTEPWEYWLGGSGAELQPPEQPGLLIDDSLAAINAACAGRGLALARWSLVSSRIATGELVAATEAARPFHRSYWLVYPRRAAALRALSQFRAWLVEEAQKFERPPPSFD